MSFTVSDIPSDPPSVRPLYRYRYNFIKKAFTKIFREDCSLVKTEQN